MKVHGPMMSLAAWGRVRLPYSMCNWIYPYGFQSYAIFQRRRTWHGMVTVLERYYTPYNPRSPAQQSQRGKFAAAVYAWQQLPPAEKYAFDALKYPIRMSGFNRFISQYVKTSVGIMVSGAGDESFNGEYNDNGAVSEGQPVYEIGGGGKYLYYTNTLAEYKAWVLHTSVEVLMDTNEYNYYNEQDPATSPKDGTWYVGIGAPPAPTVS